MLQLSLLEMRTVEGAIEVGAAIGLFLQSLRPEWCADTIVIDASEDEGIHTIGVWRIFGISNHVERKKRARTHQSEKDEESEEERCGRYGDGDE